VHKGRRCLAPLLVVACSSSTDPPPAAAPAPTTSAPPPVQTPTCKSSTDDGRRPIEQMACNKCVTGASGAVLCVGSEKCTYAVGEGGTFRYEIRLAKDTTMHVPEIPACGCATYGADPMSFVSISISGTGGVGYCATCDVGCCGGAPEQTITLAARTCDDLLTWPGKQWAGPSDTGNGLGPDFPPGDYVVHVTFGADQPLDAVVDLPIKVQ